MNILTVRLQRSAAAFMTLWRALLIVFSPQLVTLAEEKTSLLELWEERRILYEQCMDLQLFYRDTEQADAWMSKQEVRYVSILKKK